jgi:ankyrin repeat protein
MEHPILYAAEYGHTELVQYLLVSCPGSEFENNLGETPIHLAARNGSLSVIKALLNEGGAKVSMLDTNFTLAPTKEAAVNGHTHVVEYLLSDTLNKHVYTSSLLPFAAASGNITLISMLLDLGAQINHIYVERHTPRKALNSRGQGYESTALSVAVSYADITMVNHLLSHGADVNLQTGFRSRGRTPLYMALKKDDNEVGKALLAHGADIDDEHVLEAILQRNKIALKMLLAKHKMNECPINLLEEAAATEDTEIFQILLEGGFNEEAALLEAISRGQQEIVTLLLSHGTDHDLPSLCKSAVGVVIANRDVGLMRVLLRYGVYAYPEDLAAARLFAPEHIVKLAEKFPLHSLRKRDMYPGPFVAYNASQEGWLSVDQDWGSTRRRLW